MGAAGESGGIPRVSIRFSLSVENEQADARWDGRTYLARTNSQARTGTGKKIVHLCPADSEQDRQPYPVDPYSAESADPTCIHTPTLSSCLWS